MNAKSKDRHHIFFWRRMYGKGAAKTLRQHWYCSALVPVEPFHRALHHEVVLVPVPPDRLIYRALHHLAKLERARAITSSDSLEKRLAILIVLFEEYTPTRNALNQQLKVCRSYPCR